MSFASDEIRNDTIRECREQLHQLTQPQTEEHTTSSGSTIFSPNNMFADVIFGTQRSSSLDELDYYLDFRRTPLALRNSDPLLWWQQQQIQFPILSKLARKYLGIPATSVPSERLFSDAGNHITPRRSNLKPKLVSRMLFLKRNDNFINMFPNSHLYKQKKAESN